MTAYDWTIAILALCLFIVAVSYRILWLFRKKTYTRERFAFFGLTCILTSITVSLPIVSGQNTWLAVLSTLTDHFWNRPIDTGAPDWSDRIVFLTLVTLVTVAVVRMFTNWDGVKSLHQFQLEKERLRSTLIKDALLALKRDPRLRPIDPKKDEAVQLEMPEPVAEALSWHDQLAQLLTLSSNQYKINVHTDWHAREKCFLSAYGKNNAPLAILCTLEEPKQAQLSEFLQYAKATIGQLGPIEYICASRRGSGIKWIEWSDGTKLQLVHESDLLDTLVDFTNYFDYLIGQYERSEIIDGYRYTIKDIYTKPRCFVRQRNQEQDNSTDVEDIEDHIANWLSDTKNTKQLAILGEYGQGKTVLALRIAYLIARKDIACKRIPVIVELRGKYPKQYPNALSLLAEWSARFSINPQALLKLHFAGRLLLIFEGFDEMELIGDYSVRVDHFRRLWEFSTPNSKIVITGRPNFFLNDNELHTLLRTSENVAGMAYCEEIYLNRFSMDEIQEALRNVKPDVRDEILSVLKVQTKTSTFYDLLSRPASLFLTAIVWKERGMSRHQGVINSAMVIDEFLKHSYSRQAGKNVKTPLSLEERAYFMQGIAVGMCKGNGFTNQINISGLREIVKKLYDGFPEETTQANAMGHKYGEPLKRRFDNRYSLDTVLADVTSCGILVRDLGTFDSFKFAHKSFLELLISQYSIVQIVDSPVGQNLEELQWRSINMSLDVDASLQRTTDVQSFMAQLCARRISLDPNWSDQEKVRYLFKKMSTLRWISMKKALWLLPIITHGAQPIWISLIMYTVFIPMSAILLRRSLNPYTVSAMFVIMLASLSYVMLKRRKLAYAYIGIFSRMHDPNVVEVTRSEITDDFMNYPMRDPGNIFLWLLTCRELGLEEAALKCMPTRLRAAISPTSA